MDAVLTHKTAAIRKSKGVVQGQREGGNTSGSSEYGTLVEKFFQRRVNYSWQKSHFLLSLSLSKMIPAPQPHKVTFLERVIQAFSGMNLIELNDLIFGPVHLHLDMILIEFFIFPPQNFPRGVKKMLGFLSEAF
ncbi:hypothetical protein CDAR_22681 [Caerostris darwini]|uniref:Uncharacterized protein n=1 Tax=Caerostris darwini TaxID=1538125 RepID=A0AAV4S2J9_9ARAC|nr:hypothetical protein CDAR_22681 [Caerostris darwini]